MSDLLQTEVPSEIHDYDIQELQNELAEMMNEFKVNHAHNRLFAFIRRRPSIRYQDINTKIAQIAKNLWNRFITFWFTGNPFRTARNYIGCTFVGRYKRGFKVYGEGETDFSSEDWKDRKKGTQHTVLWKVSRWKLMTTLIRKLVLFCRQMQLASQLRGEKARYADFAMEREQERQKVRLMKSRVLRESGF